MFYYFYVTSEPETGRFYFGVHGTKNLFDGYQGSGYWVKAAQKAGRVLDTKILTHHASAHDAYAEEARVVNAEMLSNPLCMNMCLGGRGRRDVQSPKEVWRRRDALLQEKRQWKQTYRNHKDPIPFDAIPPGR